MDEELPVEERSGRVVRKPSEPTPEERSAHEVTLHCVSCRASDPAHRPTGGGRIAHGADRLPVRFGEDEHGDQRRTSPHSLADGHRHHGNFLWKGRSRCYAVLEERYRLFGSVLHWSACGLGSRIRNFGAEGRPRKEPHDVA